MITGNPLDGFVFHGPFDNRDDAIEWGEMDGGDWWIAPLMEDCGLGSSGSPERSTDAATRRKV